MSTLPTNRTTSDTAEEHVDDHNELHRLHNLFDGTPPLPTPAGGTQAGFVATTDGVNVEWQAPAGNTAGPSSARPTGVRVGYQYFDQTLGRPIWWNGTVWVDAQHNPITSPPVAPTGLTSHAGSSGQVVLSWNANTEIDLASYNIYKQNGDGSWPALPLDNVSAPTVTDTIGSLTNGTAVTFRITAVNSGGLESPASSTTTATPAASGTVTSPQNLAVTLGAGQAFLNWKSPTSGVPDTYAIVVTRVGGASLPTMTVTPSSATWEKAALPGLTVGQSYTVSITATKTAATGPAATSASQLCQPTGVNFSPLLTTMPSGDRCCGVWLGSRIRDWAGTDHTIPTSLTTGATAPNYTTDTTVVGQIITAPITRNTGVHVNLIGCKIVATNDSSYASSGMVRIGNTDTTGHFTSNYCEYDGSTGYTDSSTYSKDTYGNVSGGVFACIDGANFTSQSDYLHHASHAWNVHFNANATIQASACWKMVDSTTTQTQHIDCIYTGGGSTILYQYNHVQNDWNQTGGIVCGGFDSGAVTLANITVDTNIIEGGGWQYIGHSGNSVLPTGVTFSNNTFLRAVRVATAITIAASMGTVTMNRAINAAYIPVSGSGYFGCDDGTWIPFTYTGRSGSNLQGVATATGAGKTVTPSASTAGPQLQGTVRFIGSGTLGLGGQWYRACWNNGPINEAQVPSNGGVAWTSASYPGNVYEDGSAVTGFV